MAAADDGEATGQVPSVPAALNPCFVLMGPWPKCTAVPFWFIPSDLFVESKGENDVGVNGGFSQHPRVLLGSAAGCRDREH